MMRKKKNMKRKAGAVLLSVMMLSALMTAGMQISFAAETPTGAESGAAEQIRASAQSFSVRTYNERRAEDDQNIEVKVKFDRSIRVDDGAESDVSVKIAGSPLDQSPNTENGVSNRTLSVAADPEDDTQLIITIGSVPQSQFVKQTNASIQIQESDAGISHILTADSGEPVNLRYMESVIPCGLEINTADSQTAGRERTRR